MGAITMRFAVLATVAAVTAGLVFYFFSRSIVSDVTHLADAARQVGNGNLDVRAKLGKLPETKDLAVAFNAMLDSIARSRKALAKADEQILRKNVLAEMGKFSMMVAHEVKNPLSIIKGSVDILKKDPAQGATMIEYMEDEVRRLNRLVEDFLAYARPAQPSFKLVDVNVLVREELKRCELGEAGSGVNFVEAIAAEQCRLRVDKDLLGRAFRNLIMNACQAVTDREDAAVRVATSCRADRWLVTVSDNGGGVSEDVVEKVFEPFFTTRSKGTGLGLAFVQQIVEAHGGTIRAGNGRHGGAEFVVEIGY